MLRDNLQALAETSGVFNVLPLNGIGMAKAMTGDAALVVDARARLALIKD